MEPPDPRGRHHLGSAGARGKDRPAHPQGILRVQVRAPLGRHGPAGWSASLRTRTPKWSWLPKGTMPPGMAKVTAKWPLLVLLYLGFEKPSTPFTDSFWMDIHEVTNREFKAFVDAGGYRKRELWKHAFVNGGQTLSWEEATALFKDATGRPGPSGWELSSYPEGQAEYPVTGVSWYEAAAYARVRRQAPADGVPLGCGHRHGQRRLLHHREQLLRAPRSRRFLPRRPQPLRTLRHGGQRSRMVLQRHGGPSLHTGGGGGRQHPLLQRC